MNISGATNNQSQCFSHVDHQINQMFNEAAAINIDELVSSSSSSSFEGSQTLVYNLSILKDKIHQVQSLVTMVVNNHHHESSSTVAAAANTLIQDIIVAASSMMYAFEQAAAIARPSSSTNELLLHHHHRHAQQPPPPPPPLASQIDNATTAAAAAGVVVVDHTVDLHGFDVSNNKNNNKNNNGFGEFSTSDRFGDIIEIDAADLLAKYTHYCHVCGKGFKRDANLRMHMRAHGDEYKTSAALSNPMKSVGGGGGVEVQRKYSCPQEGCRWNRKHAKFQPLKSMICVKNHYKRSHCPKMYVCNRCNMKQFSVLSDLKTHEKHCGDLKWQCSCGTTFSRKDKLMGHLALFVGHSPAAAPDSALKIQQQRKKMMGRYE